MFTEAGFTTAQRREKVESHTLARSERTNEPVRIWVVDDDPEERAQVFSELKLGGVLNAIQVVSSGKALLRFLKKHPPPDVVLLEMSLLDTRSLDLLKYVRKHFEKCTIVAMSHYASPAFVEKIRQEGASFLKKPFKIGDLLHTLRTTGDVQGIVITR